MNPRRILAIHVARIGDTLLTIPALHALAENFQNAEIDFLGHPKRCEVMQHLPFLNHVGGITKKTAPFLGWLGKRYDLAVVWGHDAALVRYAVRRAGTVVACHQRDDALNARLAVPVILPSDRDISLADWQLSLVEQGLGITTATRNVEYRVVEAERDWACGYLARYNLGEHMVGLIVESFHTAPHRDWPISHFADLCARLSSYDDRIRFILCGDTLPVEKIAALRSVLGERLHIVAGRLTLRQSAALMNELALYVGLDTGPSHIAAALGVPMVALFHCVRRGSLVLSPRWPERVAMIEHPTTDDCCSFATPMGEISPATVFAAACHQIERGRQ